MAEPVQLEVRAEQAGEMVEVALRQDQCDVACSLVFSHQLILRQEIAPFVMALLQQFAILMPVVGERGVVAGGAQVAAQLAQHLVAKETGRWSHGVMLSQFLSFQRRTGSIVFEHNAGLSTRL